MDESDIHRVSDELRIDLLRAAHELAAARVALTLRRFERELKYRPDQARIVRGQQGGGQFADEGRGTAKKKIVSTAAKIVRRLAPAAIANPETLPALGAAALGPMVAGVGISRAAGLASVMADGGGATPGSVHMTPFLGIPYRLDTLTLSQQSYQAQQERTKIDAECDDQLTADLKDCGDLAPSGRKSGYSTAVSYAVCERQAYKRYSECLLKGPSGIKSPLFTLGKGHG